MIAEEGLFDSFIGKMPLLPNNYSAGGLLESSAEPFVQSTENTDFFNSNFYSSDNRKRFMKFYGLEESFFKRSMLAPNTGIVKSILKKYQVSIDGIKSKKYLSVSE